MAATALCTGVLLIGSCAYCSQPPHEGSMPDSQFDVQPDPTTSIPWSSEPESTDSADNTELEYHCINGTQTDTFSGIYQSFHHPESIFVKDWNCFYTIPEEVDADALLLYPGPMTEDEALLIYARKQPSEGIRNIHVVTLKRDSNAVDVHMLDLGRVIKADPMFGGFVDETHGRLFFFSENPNQSGRAWELFLLKTDDGGSTWYEQTCDPVLYSMPRESPTIAKFLTPDIGILGYRYSGDSNFCNRTYLTRDGGKTWVLIPQLQYPYGNRSGTEVIQFQLVDDVFFLDVYHHESERQYCSRWRSTDLEQWSFEGYYDSVDNYIYFGK